MTRAIESAGLPALVGAMLLSGCLATPAQQLAATQAPGGLGACAAPAGEVLMPSGVDGERLRQLETGRPIKVYVEMLRFGDGKEDKALFPTEMAARTELSKGGLTRLLSDTILSARRFEVYDLGSSVAAEQTDIVIDTRVLEAVMNPANIEGQRKRVQVRVTMSVQMRNTYTGQNLFPAAVLVEGRTGTGSGDGTVIGPLDDPNSPAIQRQLAFDYHNALRRAFREATYRISDTVRPMAKLLSVNGCDLGFFGGSRYGIQSKDELVVFRAQTARLGDREVLASTLPVAKVRCDGVGVENAQCKVSVLVKGYQPQVGDYAVVTDEAMRRSRQE